VIKVCIARTGGAARMGTQQARRSLTAASRAGQASPSPALCQPSVTGKHRLRRVAATERTFVSEVDGISPNIQHRLFAIASTKAGASNFSSILTIRLGSWVLLSVKIGKNFRQFSIKNADTSEQKSKIF